MLVMQHVKLREVIEEHRFSRELKRIIAQEKRADEFINGAIWVLSRDPRKGKRIGSSDVWFLAMQEIPDVLPVVLYYTFDSEHMFLMSIQETLYPVSDE